MRPSVQPEPAMTSSVQDGSAYAWCFLLGGACFLGRAATGLIAGPPPPIGAEILTWIDAARGMMMLGNEALVIGAALILAGLYGFQQTLESVAPVRVTAGSVLLAAACVVCFVLGIVQGRFVYPIHGLSLTRAEDAELLASLYFGGYHLVALVFAAATAVWSLAMLKAPEWRALGYAGLVAAVGSVVNSYPDLIGPVPVFVLESMLALWWIAISLRLRNRGRTAVSHRSSHQKSAVRPH